MPIIRKSAENLPKRRAREMYKYEAKAGEKYGRLTLIKETVRTSKKHKWLCRCDCGKYVEVSIYQMKSGECRSCGCLRDEVAGARAKAMAKHNMTHTRMYKLWSTMLKRCRNPNDKDYPRYGGRGVKVCDEWKDFIKFHEWAMSHGYRDDLSIDRIDFNGNYEPSNCRWVTLADQARNRRGVIFVEYNGDKLPITLMAEKYNIPRGRLYDRLCRGWSVEDAINRPPRFIYRRRNIDA